MAEFQTKQVVVNSLSDQLEDIVRLHNNGLSIMQSFLEILTTSSEDITIAVDNGDGTTTDVTIPSNDKLFRDFTVLQNTVEALSNLGEDTTIVSEDMVREIITTSYRRSTDQIQGISQPTSAAIEQNAIFERMMSPLSYVEIELPEQFANVRHIVTRKVLVDSLDAHANGDAYSKTIALADTYKQVDEIIDTQPQLDRYYGKFSLLSVSTNSDGTLNFYLDKRTYSDMKNAVLDSRELNVGDRLNTTDGLSVFEITELKRAYVVVRRVKGFDIIKAGVSNLEYNNTVTETKTLRVPVNGGDKFIMFLSTINRTTDVQSPWSEGILVDSSTLTVVENDVSYSFDNYFASRIRNVGRYLDQLVQESTLPSSVGITPPTTVLSSDYFKVVQINKHITNGTLAEKLKKLRSDKVRYQTDLSTINTKLGKIDARLNSGSYKTAADKNKDLSDRNTLVDRKAIVMKQFETVVREINTETANSSVGKASPKFRVRGFWPIVLPTDESTGVTQQVVQYNVRYRYVSIDTGTSEPATFDMDGQTGLKSSWNDVKTEALKRVYNETTGVWEWETTRISDADVNNINQVDIPINYGEIVEFQVQPISEAGYPQNPILGGWSNIIRMEFPDNLANDVTLAELVADNAEDLRQIEVSAQLAASGLTEHVAKSRTESERYIAHSALDVDAGEVNDQGVTVTVYDKLRTMSNAITALQEQLDRRTKVPTIEIIAPDGTITQVNRYATVNVFAGYYTDDVDVYESSELGTIVSKDITLRIVNNNATTIDLGTLSTGVLSEQVQDVSYNNVPIALGSDNEPYRQLNGQILYLRNTGVSGSENYTVSLLNAVSTLVSESDRNDGVIETLKDVVEYSQDSNVFNTTSIKSDASTEGYNAFLKTHPFYVEYQSTGSQETFDAMVSEFTRLMSYGEQTKGSVSQYDYDSSVSVGFSEYDKYAVGSNTTGARLYIQPQNFTSIQVASNDYGSVRELGSGETNAILIPIRFEYRMTDALGRLNGDHNLSLTASNLEYKKKVGISMVVGGELFTFDVQVSAKYRHDSLSGRGLSITQLGTTSQANLEGQI